MKINSINLTAGLSTIDWPVKIVERDNLNAGRAANIFATGLAAWNG